MATIDSMNRDTTRLSDGPDWTFELLETYLAEVDRVAKLYRLDTYPHPSTIRTGRLAKNLLRPSRPISTVSRVWRMR